MKQLGLLGSALAIAAVASFGTAQAATVDTAKIAAAIKADEAAWGAAYAARDAAKVAGYLSKDAISMFQDTPNTMSAAASLADMTKGFKTPDPAWAFSLSNVSVDVAASGDLAVTRGTWKITYTDTKTKKVMTSGGNYVNVFRPQADGEWKITLDMVADTAMPVAKLK
jgi:ketosteroid isomerase-like protein